MAKGKKKQKQENKNRDKKAKPPSDIVEKASGPTARRNRNQKHDLSGGDDDFSAREFTHQLRQLGLYAKVIAGDGNCLFRALSDQQYGIDTNHAALRQRVCDHLEGNRADYEAFVEDDRSFDAHLAVMRTSGTYAGNMELVAYARMAGVDIKVYQPGYVYVIKGSEYDFENDPPRNTLHIAYHSWEHYSSVRNLAGPHTGPPAIQITPTILPPLQPPTDEDPPNSREKAVMNAYPTTTLADVRRLMKVHGGNPNKVIDTLYAEDADLLAALQTAEEAEAKEAIEMVQAMQMADAVESERVPESVNVKEEKVSTGHVVEGTAVDPWKEGQDLVRRLATSPSTSLSASPISTLVEAADVSSSSATECPPVATDIAEEKSSSPTLGGLPVLTDDVTAAVTNDDDAHRNDSHRNDDVHGHEEHGDGAHGDVYGDDAHGNDTHGNDAHDSDAHANDAHGNKSHGGDSHGDGSHANDAHADDTHDDDAHCDDAHDDDAHGDDAHDDDAHGDDAHDDDVHGDDAHGDDAHGDDAHGDNAHCGDIQGGDAHRDDAQREDANANGGDAHRDDAHRDNCDNANANGGDAHHDDAQHDDANANGGDAHRDDAQRNDANVNGSDASTKADPVPRTTNEKPKRMTAKERKVASKKRRKENKKLRNMGGARVGGYREEKKKDNGSGMTGTKEVLVSGMKQLYI